MTRSDQVHLLNIGLMVLSCGVALFIPFELFLFAYAILGPAHYLTEISWLHKRGFFLPGRHDFWLFGALAVLVFVVAPESSQGFTATTAIGTTIALGAALVLLLESRRSHRTLWIVMVTAVALLLVGRFDFLTTLAALFVPTLIHVYLFTGLFMLYGALKERSRWGYAACVAFLMCPAACLWIDPARAAPGQDIIASYWKGFSTLNLTLLGIGMPRTPAESEAAGVAMFNSRAGFAVMRCIAFAYLYHYLNWFSKTSVIRWHEVGAGRLSAIAVLWVAAVGVYFYDDSAGVRALLCLSMAHVYLEFPLNHISIMGTFRELRDGVSLPRPHAAPD